MIQALDDLGGLDNTLVVCIAGDNGGSPFGGSIGSLILLGSFYGVSDTVEYLLVHFDYLGSPHASIHYALVFC